MPNAGSWRCLARPVADEESTDEQHTCPFRHDHEASTEATAHDAPARELHRRSAQATAQASVVTR